jgi:hypothetical protein
VDNSNDKNEEIVKDDNLKDIIKQINKTKGLNKVELDIMLEQANESINFVSKLDEIDLKDDKFRVIFTDGENQLVYENGEFFIISTTDISKPKIKKKKQEARDMYLEYFIKYQLNPILNQVKMNNMVKTISQEVPEKDVKIEKNTKKKSILDKSLENLVEKDTKKTRITKKVEDKEKTKTVRKSKEKTIER